MFWRLGPNAVVSSGPVAPLTRAVDAVFENFRIDAAADDGRARPLELDARIDSDGSWKLFAQGSPLVSAPSPEAFAPLLEGSLIGYAVRTRRDAAAFHAGAVAIDGRGVLMVGPKGSGKSTLALHFAREGAEYLSDELALLRFDDARIVGFPKSVTVKQGSFHLFPELEGATTHYDPVRGPIRYYQAPSDAMIDRPLSLIVFPKYTPERSEVHVERLDPSIVALELVRQTFGGLERGAPKTLDLIGRLAMVPGYRIELPDCTSAVRAIRDALHDVP